ncbi:L,D-transpeptidase family protein [Neiella marina]|uniref:L,D-transpeptidase family protein n=1 Tax=Neiella holothuriorum TaxID=2870530 RepID=A0ABS7EGT9_9GAMM|nr:L,D-transpeptidase family protein [Neiella holothuriorum]MBW8191574.1 L,D-transpeptidase family protein [Neiella holothuriorum]
MLKALILLIGLSVGVAQANISDYIHQNLNGELPEETAELPRFGEHYSHLVNFYEFRDYQPIWFINGELTTQGQALLGALQQASYNGLRPDDYFADVITMILAETAFGDLSKSRAELLLTLGFLQYAADVRVGRTPPTAHHQGMPAIVHPADPQVLLQRISDGQSATDILQQMEPRSLLYRRLKQAMKTIVDKQMVDLAFDEIEIGKTLHPGDAIDQSAYNKFADRLTQLVPNAQLMSYGGTYDATMTANVKQLQFLNGLGQDGVIGQRTYKVLNKTWQQREKQVIATMERMRWLPREIVDTRYILVNVPSFTMYGIDANEEGDQQLTFVSDVIVGKSYRRYRTPLFVADMTYMVFNPYWNIPTSILKREYIPHVDKPGFLQEHNFQLVKFFSKTAEVYPPTPENIAALKRGEFLLRQSNGPHNALGEAKFIFPNSNNVYLHGTPAQSLFAKERRDFSHGCIRVADVPGLANWVLSPEGWNELSIQQEFDATDAKIVSLKKPITVGIIYLTAIVDEDNNLIIHDDIYGHDARLLNDLGQTSEQIMQPAIERALN